MTGPIIQHFKLFITQSPQTDQEMLHMSKVPYENSVESLMYPIVCTRIDVAYGVSLVSWFMSSPGKDHWLAIKWILRYLKGTMNVGLRFKSTSETDEMVSGFEDSDYAGRIDKIKSLTGYIFTICDTGGSWKASLHPVVALFTTESEYLVVTRNPSRWKASWKNLVLPRRQW